MPATNRRSPSDDLTASVDSFRRVLRALRIAARKSELSTGLSAAKMFVLSAVAASPGCSVNDIAEVTMTDRSSAAALVDRLVEQGYLTRDRSGDDRRRASIGMTARGRKASGKHATAPGPLLVAGLRKLSSSDLRALTRGLEALTRGMGIEHTPAEMLFEDARPRRSLMRSDPPERETRRRTI